MSKRRVLHCAVLGLSILGFALPVLGASKGAPAPLRVSSERVGELGAPSHPTVGTESAGCQTRRYGDVTNDGTLDLDDILCVLDGFAGTYTYCPLAFADIAPCGGGDGIINIDDIGAALEAFSGNVLCPDSCVPCANNQSPLAGAGADFAAEVGESVSFSPAFATDGDGVVVGFEWDFGDGSRSSSEAPSHTYASPGVYTVSLAVTDSCNAVGSDSVLVTVTEPLCGSSNATPVAEAGANQSMDLGVAVLIDGSGSSDVDGSVDEYWWNFGDGLSTGWQASSAAEHAYSAGGSYVVTLWVRDNCGNTSDASTLTVEVTDPQANLLNPVVMGFAKGNVGLIYGVALAGDRLYAASRDLGVVEIDVSDPSAPEVLRYSNTLAGVQGVAVSGSTILTGGATNAASVSSLDLYATDEETWASLGFVAQGMDINGHIACVAAGSSGLKVLDVSDPANPAVLATVAMFARGVAISSDGRWAYVAAGGGSDGGLKLVDLSRATPTVVSELPPVNGGNASDVVLSASGDVAYVADYGAGLGVFDVSDPYDPRRLASYRTAGGPADHVAISGDLVLVSTVVTAPQVHVFDASDPEALIEMGSTPGLYTGLVANERFLFGAAANAGIRIVDLADPWTPNVVGYVGSGVRLRTSCASNGRVTLVGGSTGRITVLDVLDPSAPVVVSEVASVGQDIVMRGDLAFVAGGISGLRVVDLSSPLDPVILATVPMFARGVALSSDGRWAFVAAAKVSGFGQVNVVDVSDPAHPVLVTGVSTGLYGIASDITLNETNTLAFVADFGTGLQIIDVSDPRSPFLVGFGFATDQPAMEVASYGDLVLVGAIGNGSKLFVVDVSNPFEPVGLGSLPMAIQGAMDIYGDYALLPTGVFGLQVLDLTDPVAMEIVASVRTPGPAYSVARFLDTAYVGDGTVVLDVLSLGGD